MKVYIAGPYTGKDFRATTKNISTAQQVAAKLYRMGYTPFCPHTMTAHFDTFYPDIPRQRYLDTDKEWLALCDAVLMLPQWRESHGAMMEKSQALRYGIPIYYCIDDLPNLAKDTLQVEGYAPDAVDHPPHYTQAQMECIEAIEGLALPFHEAQVLKYITRWRRKGGVEDLKKARWYLERLIANGGEPNVAISGESDRRPTSDGNSRSDVRLYLDSDATATLLGGDG